LSTSRLSSTRRPKLLEINFGCDDYWWSTRIFLVAALAQDFTSVEAVVFVRSGDDEVFVGIASPRAVRERLAARFPIYEEAYRKAQGAVPYLAPDDTHLDPRFNKIKNILKYGEWQKALERIGAEEKERRPNSPSQGSATVRKTSMPINIEYCSTHVSGSCSAHN
jgi:hypothetical protein